MIRPQNQDQVEFITAVQGQLDSFRSEDYHKSESSSISRVPVDANTCVPVTYYTAPPVPDVSVPVPSGEPVSKYQADLSQRSVVCLHGA